MTTTITEFKQSLRIDSEELDLYACSKHQSVNHEKVDVEREWQLFQDMINY